MPENPLQQPVPDDPVERVKVFARDLAYGATRGLWATMFKYTAQFHPQGWRKSWSSWGDEGNTGPALDEYIKAKWQQDPPSFRMLVSFGYLIETAEQSYQLTTDAFDLLQAPVTKPDVFVSYRRRESSSFALLVEARLRLADEHMKVFVDKEIEPGEDWALVLKDRVAAANVFICLIGPETFAEGSVVIDEVKWALAEKAKRPVYQIIPVWHNGFGGENDRLLGEYNAIRIKEESAEEYEVALLRLLNRLGYSNI